MFLILECANSECRMRFPAPERVVVPACPRCGAPLQRIDLPFPSPSVEPDTTETRDPRVEILLDNIRSAFNVGSILRSADGAGIQHAHLCGITPTPENPKVAKTALSAEFVTPWSYAPNGVLLVEALKQRGLPVWALEAGPDAEPLTRVLHAVPPALVIVAGNELAGVDPGILQQCNRVVALPMLGFKRSLNVAVALGIAMYWLRFAPAFQDR